MWSRVCLSFSLVLPLLLCSGCERSEVRKSRHAMDLVRTMGTELKAEGARALAAFTRRADFEELRKTFGDERFDQGTPLGPDFQRSLAAMIQDVEGQLEKEPKDSEFLRKAARRARQFNQWWVFVRRLLEARRDALAQGFKNGEPQRRVGGRVLRADVIAVLDETIKVVVTFETITQRCVRGIEDALTQS